jgi:hypothetical protein
LAGDTADTQKVTFKSSSDKHSKDDLVKSLAENAKKYIVKDVKKAAGKKGGDKKS